MTGARIASGPSPLSHRTKTLQAASLTIRHDDRMAISQAWRRDVGVTDRQAARVGGNFGRQSLREASSRANGPSAELISSFRGEQSALRAFYAAKIDVTRRSTSHSELAAALRVLFDQQKADLCELARRQSAFKIAAQLRVRSDSLGKKHTERRAQPS